MDLERFRYFINNFLKEYSIVCDNYPDELVDSRNITIGVFFHTESYVFVLDLKTYTFCVEKITDKAIINITPIFELFIRKLTIKQLYNEIYSN